jgi:hypothetical protein
MHRRKLHTRPERSIRGSGSWHHGCGSFVAKKSELEDDAADHELEGVVFKIDTTTQFEMLVVEELPDVANGNAGNPVIVTLQSGASF